MLLFLTSEVRKHTLGVFSSQHSTTRNDTAEKRENESLPPWLGRKYLDGGQEANPPTSPRTRTKGDRRRGAHNARRFSLNRSTAIERSTPASEMRGRRAWRKVSVARHCHHPWCLRALPPRRHNLSGPGRTPLKTSPPRSAKTAPRSRSRTARGEGGQPEPRSRHSIQQLYGRHRNSGGRTTCQKAWYTTGYTSG